MGISSGSIQYIYVAMSDLSTSINLLYLGFEEAELEFLGFIQN